VGNCGTYTSYPVRRKEKQLQRLGKRAWTPNPETATRISIETGGREVPGMWDEKMEGAWQEISPCWWMFMLRCMFPCYSLPVLVRAYSDVGLSERATVPVLRKLCFWMHSELNVLYQILVLFSTVRNNSIHTNENAVNSSARIFRHTKDYTHYIILEWVAWFCLLDHVVFWWYLAVMFIEVSSQFMCD
jgi:hypothetical protein